MLTDCDELSWNGYRQFGVEKRVELLHGNKKHHGHNTDHQCGQMSVWKLGANVHQSLKLKKRKQPFLPLEGYVTLIHFHLMEFNSSSYIACNTVASASRCCQKLNNLNRQKSQGKASRSYGGTALLMASQVREEEKIGQERRIERGVQTNVILFPGYTVNLT